MRPRLFSSFALEVASHTGASRGGMRSWYRRRGWKLSDPRALACYLAGRKLETPPRVSVPAPDFSKKQKKPLTSYAPQEPKRPLPDRVEEEW